MAKVLVYGFSESGKGAVKLLNELGEDVAVYDDIYKGDINNVEDRRFLNEKDVLKDINLVVLSPSVAFDAPIIKLAESMGIKCIAEIELAYNHCLADIIAITGTNGKTTTTLLMTQMLKNSAIETYSLGNIGLSFSSQVSLLKQSDVVVLEASSFQLEGIDKFKPKFAICLNIAPDHLERHKNMQNYIDAKFNIFKNQSKSDYSILNYDDKTVRELAQNIDSKVYYISKTNIVKGAYVCGNGIYFNNGIAEYICSITDIAMQGAHNLENILACVCVCKILNIPNGIILKTLKEFTPPEHRIEYVKTIRGVKYFNDSKATNIHSTLCAAKSMKGKTALIIGGFDKGLDYTELFKQLPLKIGTIILCGANSDKILAGAKGISTLTFIKTNSLEESVQIASKVVCENVLFSPTTSSYDAYKNYAERGEHFKKIVGELNVE